MRRDLLPQYSPIKSSGFPRVHLRAHICMYIVSKMYKYMYNWRVLYGVQQQREGFGQPETWASHISQLSTPCSLSGRKKIQSPPSQRPSRVDYIHYTSTEYPYSGLERILLPNCCNGCRELIQGCPAWNLVTRLGDLDTGNVPIQRTSPIFSGEFFF